MSASVALNLSGIAAALNASLSPIQRLKISACLGCRVTDIPALLVFDMGAHEHRLCQTQKSLLLAILIANDLDAVRVYFRRGL